MAWHGVAQHKRSFSFSREGPAGIQEKETGRYWAPDGNRAPSNKIKKTLPEEVEKKERKKEREKGRETKGPADWLAVDQNITPDTCDMVTPTIPAGKNRPRSISSLFSILPFSLPSVSPPTKVARRPAGPETLEGFTDSHGRLQCHHLPRTQTPPVPPPSTQEHASLSLSLPTSSSSTSLSTLLPFRPLDRKERKESQSIPSSLVQET